MGKLIALLVALGACLGIYRGCFYKSPAYQAYLQWTAATMEGDCKTLYVLADGDTKKWVDFFCTPQGGMTIMGQVVQGQTAAAMVSDLRNTPQGSMRGLKHEIESESESSDGTVSLVVTEYVMARPSNWNKPAPPRRHEVKVREVGGVWKVVEFKDMDR